MTEIVVYDLNKTLYYKSSKDEFFKFICYKKGYKIAHFFQLISLKFLSDLRLIGKTFFKENFYSYLNNLPPDKVEKYARQFWDMEFPECFNHKLLEGLKEHHANGTPVYIITGGFEVYTKYLEKLLPVKVYGTRTAYQDGAYQVIGEACNGEEKVKRLNEEAPLDYKLIESYSDAKEPILFKAEKSFYIDDGEIIPI